MSGVFVNKDLNVVFLEKSVFIIVIDSILFVFIDFFIENIDGKILLGYWNNWLVKGYWFVFGGRI